MQSVVAVNYEPRELGPVQCRVEPFDLVEQPRRPVAEVLRPSPRVGIGEVRGPGAELVELGGVPRDVTTPGPVAETKPMWCSPAGVNSPTEEMEVRQGLARDDRQPQPVRTTQKVERVVDPGHEVEHGEHAILSGDVRRTVGRAAETDGGHVLLFEPDEDRVPVLDRRRLPLRSVQLEDPFARWRRNRDVETAAGEPEIA